MVILILSLIVSIDILYYTTYMYYTDNSREGGNTMLNKSTININVVVRVIYNITYIVQTFDDNSNLILLLFFWALERVKMKL